MLFAIPNPNISLFYSCIPYVHMHKPDVGCRAEKKVSYEDRSKYISSDKTVQNCSLSSYNRRSLTLYKKIEIALAYHFCILVKI